MIAAAMAIEADLTIPQLTYRPTSTGGNVFLDWMPDDPNVAVAFMTQPGRPQLGKGAHDFPDVQALVRGAPYDAEGAHALAQAICDAFHCRPASTWAAGTDHEVWVIGCTAAQSSPVPIGRDARERPEYSLNFRLTVHQPTTHRQSA